MASTAKIVSNIIASLPIPNGHPSVLATGEWSCAPLCVFNKRQPIIVIRHGAMAAIQAVSLQYHDTASVMNSEVANAIETSSRKHFNQFVTAVFPGMLSWNKSNESPEATIYNLVTPNGKTVVSFNSLPSHLNDAKSITMNGTSWGYEYSSWFVERMLGGEDIVEKECETYSSFLHNLARVFAHQLTNV